MIQEKVLCNTDVDRGMVESIECHAVGKHSQELWDLNLFFHDLKLMESIEHYTCIFKTHLTLALCTFKRLWDFEFQDSLEMEWVLPPSVQCCHAARKLPQDLWFHEVFHDLGYAKRIEEHWTCIQMSLLTLEICKILNSLTQVHEFEGRF